MPVYNRIQGAIRAFGNDETATATVEFVLVFPSIMWLVFSILEAGWLMTEQTMLDRGLNMAVRELRLGIGLPATHDSIKTSICTNARILHDCMNTLRLELVPLSDPISSASASCIDRSATVQPVVNWVLGSRTNPEIMVLRACFVVDPLVPGAGFGAMLPKDSTGGFHMVSYSAFANEPGI